MVRRGPRRPAPSEPAPVRFRWGLIYAWLLLVFACILLATVQSVERKRQEMRMDGLIERKLSLQNELAEVRAEYYRQQSFDEVSRRIERLGLDLGPSRVPAFVLAVPAKEEAGP